jgi:hypothetical protein
MQWYVNQKAERRGGGSFIRLTVGALMSEVRRGRRLRTGNFDFLCTNIRRKKTEVTYKTLK